MTPHSEIYCLLVVAILGPLPCCQDIQGKDLIFEFVEDSKPRASRVLNTDATAAKSILWNKSLMVWCETHGDCGTLVSVRMMNAVAPNCERWELPM